MPYLMGIDIGTSGTKTVLFDEKGSALAGATAEYPMYQPRSGWAEQQPEDWWKAVVLTVKEVLNKAQVSGGEVGGIGLSGQMHGLVMLDEKDLPLRRSIIWCDQRTAAECEQIEDLAGGRRRLMEITANPALTGFTASKILWVRNNEPEIYEKCKKILLPKDYVRLCMTGEYATEVSDASGMQLLDIPARKWSGELLEKLGIDPSLLAKVYESPEITGRISNKCAELTGLVAGTPVVGGAGDQAASAVGNGIVREGVVSSTLGTSGVVFAFSENVTVDPLGRVHTFCHAVPGKWHIMGVTQAAGLSLKWYRDNFCISERQTAELMEKDPYYLMDMQAEKVAAGCDGILYLPYLMGERTPHLDPDARGVFFGLSARHTRRDLLRAVMEGVGFSLRDCMEIIREMGVPVNEVRASGGGGRSRLWRQIQADMFGAGVYTLASGEGGALGVAILAGVGTGVYAGVEQGCAVAVRTAEEQRPDPTAAAVYNKNYVRYKQLYQSLKQDFKQI